MSFEPIRPETPTLTAELEWKKIGFRLCDAVVRDSESVADCKPLFGSGVLASHPRVCPSLTR